MRSTAALLLTLPVLVLTACGEGGGDGAGTDRAAGTPAGTPAGTTTGAPPASVARPAGEVTTRHPVAVLDDGSGAELCLGGVAESYPPQCSGLRLAGWDWAAQRGRFEEAAGVRWGEFVVTGRYDGDVLTPTRVRPAAEVAPPAYDDGGPTCPEDDGAGGDGHEASCGPRSGLSRSELHGIQEQLAGLPGLLTAGVAEGWVEVGVIHDDGSLQAWADERFGPGAVRVGSALVPAG